MRTTSAFLLFGLVLLTFCLLSAEPPTLGYVRFSAGRVRLRTEGVEVEDGISVDYGDWYLEGNRGFVRGEEVEVFDFTLASRTGKLRMNGERIVLRISSRSASFEKVSGEMWVGDVLLSFSAEKGELHEESGWAEWVRFSLVKPHKMWKGKCRRLEIRRTDFGYLFRMKKVKFSLGKVPLFYAVSLNYKKKFKAQKTYPFLTPAYSTHNGLTYVSGTVGFLWDSMGFYAEYGEFADEEVKNFRFTVDVSPLRGEYRTGVWAEFSDRTGDIFIVEGYRLSGEYSEEKNGVGRFVRVKTTSVGGVYGQGVSAGVSLKWGGLSVGFSAERDSFSTGRGREVFEGHVGKEFFLPRIRANFWGERWVIKGSSPFQWEDEITEYVLGARFEGYSDFSPFFQCKYSFADRDWAEFRSGIEVRTGLFDIISSYEWKKRDFAIKFVME